jgi:hypothetical protein
MKKVTKNLALVISAFTIGVSANAQSKRNVHKKRSTKK